jgi:hypothetical protein
MVKIEDLFWEKLCPMANEEGCRTGFAGERLGRGGLALAGSPTRQNHRAFGARCPDQLDPVAEAMGWTPDFTPARQGGPGGSAIHGSPEKPARPAAA